MNGMRPGWYGFSSEKLQTQWVADLAGCNYIRALLHWKFTSGVIFMESLILAQDERLRRA